MFEEHILILSQTVFHPIDHTFPLLKHSLLSTSMMLLTLLVSSQPTSHFLSDPTAGFSSIRFKNMKYFSVPSKPIFLINTISPIDLIQIHIFKYHLYAKYSQILSPVQISPVSPELSMHIYT